MKYPIKFQKLLKTAKKWKGMKLHEEVDEYNRMLPIAENLVKQQIHGDRKGMTGEPNYMHSFRVQKIVEDHHHWDDPDYELFLAALLHDIVEDGDITFEKLVEVGFSNRTIELIYLCTHDKSMENHTERWTLMVARLIEARDEEAWFIKLADLSDNLNQSSGLSEENRKFMIDVKVPMILRLTEWLDGYSRPHHAFLQEALNKLKK